MAKPSILQLSQELIDEIVDFVEQGSLRACAATHRTFLHRCQSRLFSTLSFSSARSEYDLRFRKKRARSLLEILQQSPHIARYVRGLYLSISSHDNRWVAEDPDFMKVLSLVKQSGSSIRTLKLIGTEFPEKLSDARLFEQNFLQPYISSSLTTLVISGLINVPMSLIANSPNLTDLKTFRSSLEGFGDNLDYTLLQCSPKIRHLRCFPPDATIESILHHNLTSPKIQKLSGIPKSTPDLYAGVFLDTMIGYEADIGVPPIADLTELRSITTVARDLDVLQNIIKLSKNTLEELYILDQDLYSDNDFIFNDANYSMRFVGLGESIDLSEIHRLRILLVDIMFPPPLTKDNSLQDICTVLKTIPSENCLERITLNTYVGYETSAYGPSSANYGSWEVLDSEITRIAHDKPLEFYLTIYYIVPDAEFCWGDNELTEFADSFDFDREVEELCDRVFHKLVRERLLKISSSSSIALDFKYNVGNP